jgi:hypothetical protein
VTIFDSFISETGCSSDAASSSLDNADEIFWFTISLMNEVNALFTSG